LPASAILASLAAAVVHATWNVAVSRAPDSERRMRAACVWAVVLLAPIAAATWEATRAAIPFMVASSAAHTIYFLGLGRAYRDHDVDVLYAVSRGTGPVLVLVLGVLVLGDDVSLQAALGVIAVAAGVLGLRLAGGAASSTAVIWGLSIGVFIATYTLLDAEGVERADPAAFLIAVLVPLGLICLVLLVRSGGRAELREPAALATGAGMITAYLLVLWALQRAPAAPVAALRETSILLVALAAGLGGGRRVGAAALVCAGVALVVSG
jgi:drug/metabolite transporter (DMT)-like permease